ncbi:MAG: hypothetical protein PGN07_05610 [Aeromicrobium erythreum]
MFPAALRASSEDGRLVAAPWWIDPYLLWYRGLSAERAGLDATKPVTWDDLLAGAERVGGTVQIDDPDGQGLASWVDALVRGAAGPCCPARDGRPASASTPRQAASPPASSSTTPRRGSGPARPTRRSRGSCPRPGGFPARADVDPRRPAALSDRR